MNFKGIIPALITPFDERHEVNYTSLRRLVNRLIDQGVGGFYVCGSTGECFLMDDDERKQIVEVVTEEVHGRVGVVVHVGSINVRKAVEYARHAQSCGADGVSSVPPFYFKFKLPEIANYYGAISDAVDVPLIIYNIPSLSGVALTADDIPVIRNKANVMGIKYTSYDLYELEKIKRKIPDLKLYYGHDEMFCSALPIGLTGAIGSTYNVMAKKFISIQNAFEKGNTEEAFRLQAEANTVLDAMLKGDVKAGAKYMLSKAGVPCGDMRPPFLPLSEAEKSALDAVLPLAD